MPLDKFVVFIPNAIIPYGYELVNIMAYPNGFKYRFRFEQRYVQEKVQLNIPELINKKAYIVLRDRSTAKLYPIRFCKITDARKIASVFYFEYELEDIIEYDSKENLRTAQISDFESKFLDFHKTEMLNNKPDSDMNPLVLFSNYSPTIKNQNYSTDTEDMPNEQWLNVISAVKDIKLYEDLEFIRLVDLVNMRDGGIVQIRNNAFLLHEGNDYALRVFQYIPMQTQVAKSPRDIKILVDDKYIGAIRAQHRAVGKYDVLKFLIRTNIGSGSKRSFIDIERIAKVEADSSIEPKIHIPVTIKKSAKQITLMSLLILLSFVIYVSPELEDYLPFDKEKLKDFAIVTFTFALMGFYNEFRGYLGK